MLSRPPRYSNNRAEWPLFKFMMRTYVGAISEELLDAMNQAEAQAGPIVLARLNDEHRTYSRTLMYVLVSSLQGSALQMAMNTEISNGLEAWRGLVKREEPTEGSTQVAVLMTIMRAQFTGGMQGLTEELEKLMGQVQRYEAQFDDPIADTIVQAIIKSNCPDELKSQVTMATYASARELRDMLVGYAATRAAEYPTPPGGQAPMDVGGIDNKGKGKGKKGKKGGGKKGGGKGGKGKGKEKGKEDTGGKAPAQDGGGWQKFQGYCNNCGIWGHKKTDCWKKPVAAIDTATGAAAAKAAAEQPPGLGGSVAMVEFVGEEAGGDPAAEE